MFIDLSSGEKYLPYAFHLVVTDFETESSNVEIGNVGRPNINLYKIFAKYSVRFTVESHPRVTEASNLVSYFQSKKYSLVDVSCSSSSISY